MPESQTQLRVREIIVSHGKSICVFVSVFALGLVAANFVDAPGLSQSLAYMGVMILLVGYILPASYRVWRASRPAGELPNKAPEPTPTSVMPAAKQPSRRP